VIYKAFGDASKVSRTCSIGCDR